VSRREDIDNAIWSDPEFVALTADAKLLYIWSFTNSSCGMAGIYKAPMGLAAYQTGLTERRVEKAAAELANARFMFWTDGVIWVRARVKHLRTRTSQIATSVANDVAKIAEGHPLRLGFLEEYGEYGFVAEKLAPLRNPLNLKRTSPEVHGRVG
jgi:hypothetical protein